MKYHFLPYFLTSALATALASICVVLQTRNTFQWQLAPVIASVWPPGTMWRMPFSLRHLRHRERQRRIDVAEQEVDLVALDQLARLLHGGAGVAAGRILDQQLDLAAENAALGVDLLDRQLAADQFVLAERGVGAGQRIVEADLDRVGGAGADDERTGELGGGKDRPRFDESTAVYAGAPIGLGQAFLPCSADWDFKLGACRASSTSPLFVDRTPPCTCGAQAVKRSAVNGWNYRNLGSILRCL